MELSDVRVALRRYWFVAVLAMVFWVLIGAAMALLPEGRYRASATMLVTPSTALGTSSVQVANFQIPGIIAVIQSRSFTGTVAEQLPTRFGDHDVDVTASVEPGTGIIRVSVEATDPEAAAAWATALVNGILTDDVAENELIDVSILDEAGVPTTPVSPQRVPIFGGTIVLGLFSAVLAAVVMMRMRRAFDVVKEIERRLDLPVIGRIPAIRSLQRSSGAGAAEQILATPDLMEAFQALRTNLELALFGAPPESQVVAVSSWGAGEGKSTVAAGLAMTMAASGTDVLAVDVDLRRPELHNRLGQPFGPGLADADRQPLESLIIPTTQRNLTLLRAGNPSRHPADVLASTLESVLEFARRRAWRVILDPPPYQGVAETGMALSSARYVVLVVDVRRSKLPELENMTTRLRATGVNIVGVALNRVPKSQTDSAYAPYAPRVERSRRTGREPGPGPRPPTVTKL